MYAGDDAGQPGRQPRLRRGGAAEVVSAHCFDDLYHEIFNELGREPVFDAPQAVAGRAVLTAAADASAQQPTPVSATGTSEP